MADTEFEGELGSPAEQKVQVKFLFSTAAAGSIIGKGGSTISEFQNSSKARIQLSKAGEFFPGTNLRVVQITGTLLQVATALQLVLRKLQDEELLEKPQYSEDETAIEVQLTAPIRLCGSIIGKQGATINHFKEDSGASIRVQALDSVLHGVQERIITLGGSSPQILRAMCLIVTKMSEDQSYQNYISQPITSSTQVGLLHSNSASVPKDSPFSRSQYEVSIGIPEDEVGAIIGRNGANITEIQQACRVRIKISDKGDFIPGTNERRVTVTGTHDAVQMAQLMMQQKLRQAVGNRNRGGGGIMHDSTFDADAADM
eukprot:TRINITY_DN1470_c1_g1_i6.p1 TRINITY_DN1470_c1_g1~~TRINITY_DN1470_c1_g1_i6.p1  ORF type:complete len:315 (-),score=30.07 TRINITY_DN1470_c1_g1_i6:948-1892(-)